MFIIGVQGLTDKRGLARTISDALASPVSLLAYQNIGQSGSAQTQPDVSVMEALYTNPHRSLPTQRELKCS